VPSDSLVPKADPSLLFTNAGMNQFKAYFLGQMRGDPMKRATTHQKCFRATDIEKVGHTAQHHTFFEMLGNFSFGDYFKEEAIPFGWELVTEKYKLPVEQLWVTIYLDDDQAAEIWEKEAGVSPDRIVRLGEEENFWKMGETGPCGPCSEIHIDLGEKVGCGKPLAECGPACECDRFSELYNLVFMQYDRQKDGSLEPLPRPSIDTGMGLERMCRILQGVPSSFETDLFQPLIGHIESLCGKNYGEDARDDVSMRIMADHGRGALFLIADGITPSNVGRGYVLRRIIRRAVKAARLLGIEKLFLADLFNLTTGMMERAYPETRENLEYATKMATAEEERFGATLERGMAKFVDILEEARNEGRPISGEEAFTLYDTYGFPFDLTLEAAQDEGTLVDREGFEREMDSQREKARQQAKFVTDVKAAFGEALDLPATEFLGYETETATAKVLGVYSGGKKLERAAAEDGEVQVVLDRTPFYAEAGGQIGDRGTLRGRVSDADDVQLVFTVTDTQKTPAGTYLHRGKVEHGQVEEGIEVDAEVDHERRLRTRRNHTATHLLQAALREILGDHVRQSGSRVSPEGFRFDFTHLEAMKPDEIERVEKKINEWVYQDIPVNTDELTLEEATEKGAIAFFEEKYGEKVRVLQIGDVSMELCGGTHCGRSADIGLAKIAAESSIAAGIRRIEGVTALDAYELLARRDRVAREASRMLKASPEELPEKIEKLQEETRKLAKERETASQADAETRLDDILGGKQAAGDAEWVVAHAEGVSARDLNHLADRVRDRLGKGAALLAASDGKKITFVAVVTKDLTGTISASDLAREVAKVAGGGGGGRPDRAQAGGKDPSKLEEALETGRKMIREKLGE
jgi:alanyl-tRNA synthetase